MNFNKYLIIVAILLSSTAYAEDQKPSRKPLSEITVANLKLGVTVDEYKQSNPKAVFKPVNKDGYFHHFEFSKEEPKGQDRTRLVLEADQAGRIYWIKYRRFYPTPMLFSDIYQPLKDLYGEPIGSGYDDDIAYHCWHGCVAAPPSNYYETRSMDRLLVQSHKPQFYVAIYGTTVDTIKDFTRHGIEDRLPNGWLEYNLIDGERQENANNDWEARIIERNSRKVDISPN
jgi:hypothetical protein